MEETREHDIQLEKGETASDLEEQKAEEELEKERSKTDLAHVIIKEEEERYRRIAQDAYLDEVEAERRRNDKAYSVIAMEEEKQRLVAQDQYLDILEAEQSIRDRMETSLMEEKERDRRIQKELRRIVREREQREDSKAEVIIKEEQERARRVSLDQYLDEVEKERSETSRAFTRIEEEDEKWRRLAESEYEKTLPGAPKVPVVPVFVPEILQKVPLVQPEGTQTVPSESRASLLQPVSKGAPVGTTQAPSEGVETGKEPKVGVLKPSGVTAPVQGTQKPVIVVFAGTGMQGKSVLKWLIADGKWTLRTLVRTTSAKTAVKLAQKGVEVIGGNMHNEQDLKRVLTGAYGVFAVTNYWDPETMGRETELGCKMARIAKEAGVRHYIWSTLPNVEKITRGRFLVPHFTGKARVNPYIRDLGFETYTFLRPSFYYENFATSLAPKKDETGKHVWTIPLPENAFLTAFDVRDMGPMATIAFNNPDAFHKRKLNLAGDHMHPQDYVIQFSYITRCPAKVELISPAEFSKTRVPFATEMAEMFAYFAEYGFFGGKDWTTGKKVYPQLKTWKEYLSLLTPIEQSF